MLWSPLTVSQVSMSGNSAGTSTSRVVSWFWAIAAAAALRSRSASASFQALNVPILVLRCGWYIYASGTAERNCGSIICLHLLNLYSPPRRVVSPTGERIGAVADVVAHEVQGEHHRHQ